MLRKIIEKFMRSKKYYENIYPEILGETFEKQEIIKISKKFL